MNERLVMTRRVLFGLASSGLVLMLALVVGCSGGAKEVSAEEIEAAQAAVGSFKKALQTELREGLRGGPENAIEVCRVKASEIASELSGERVAV